MSFSTIAKYTKKIEKQSKTLSTEKEKEKKLTISVQTPKLILILTLKHILILIHHSVFLGKCLSAWHISTFPIFLPKTFQICQM